MKHKHGPNAQCIFIFTNLSDATDAKKLLARVKITVCRRMFHNNISIRTEYERCGYSEKRRMTEMACKFNLSYTFSVVES